MAEQVLSTDQLPAGTPRPYWWMWPARRLELVRPGLRAATDADARRLRALPSVIGSVIIPALAIGLPLLASIGTATTEPFAQGDPYDPWALLQYDLYTESILFMLAGLALGLLSPAAGLLFVIAYAIGNVAATVITGELEPPLPALFGRFATYIVLWLLVGEISLFGRQVIEWWRGPAAPPRRRALALLGAVLVTTGLVALWTFSSVILIGAMFWLTAPFGSGPTLRATNTLEVEPGLFIVPSGILALLLLGIRYRGVRAPLATSEPVDPPPAGMRLWARRILGLGLGLTVVSGTLNAIPDVAVMVAALLFGRPLARLILRATGLARPLARIDWPIRLALATAASIAFSFVFLSVFFNVDISRWFYLVVAIAVSFVIVLLAFEADAIALEQGGSSDGAAADPPATSAPVVAALVAGLALVALAVPQPVSADAAGDLVDMAVIIAAFASGMPALILGWYFGPGDKPQQPPKKTPPRYSYYTRTPGGPPVPFGTPPPKPPPQPDGFKWTDPSTWF